MSKTLAEVQIPGRGLDLAKVLGKDLLRIEGRISTEFGEPTFVLTQIVFTDGTEIGCEGEHDMPYVTAPYEDGPARRCGSMRWRRRRCGRSMTAPRRRASTPAATRWRRAARAS